MPTEPPVSVISEREITIAVNSMGPAAHWVGLYTFHPLQIRMIIYSACRVDGVS